MPIAIFPVLSGMEYPVNRFPVLNTTRHAARSGRRTALPHWTAPLYDFELSFSYLGAEASRLDWQTLEGFWKTTMVTPGQFFQFAFREDASCTNESLGTGNGVTTVYQLVRTLGGFVEPVLAALTGVFKVNGVTVTATINAGGTVTFAAPPGNGLAITWTGTFNWLCQWDQDTAEFSNFAYLFWELKKLTFRSSRL